MHANDRQVHHLIEHPAPDGQCPPLDGRLESIKPIKPCTNSDAWQPTGDRICDSICAAGKKGSYRPRHVSMLTDLKD
jgi:hypothetical protein